VRFEVENSGLAPADLAGVLPGPVDRVTRETGERGPLVEILVSVAENVAAGVVTAALIGIWAAWRKGRERDLKDFSSTTVRVEIVGDGETTDIVLDLHGDGSESARKLEREIGDAMDEGRVHRIRFTFPEDR
jgi:hypothetical protein